MEVAALSVQVKSEKNAISKFNIVYNATENGFAADSIKLHLYKYEETEAISTTDNYFNCTHAVDDTDPTEGELHYFDKCTDWTSESSNKLTTNSAELVDSKTLVGTTEVQFETQEVTGSATGKTVYYYVVVEYVNKKKTSKMIILAKI